MNEFSSTENSAGLLKDYYDDGSSLLSKALKKKRQRLAESKKIQAGVDEEIADQLPEVGD